MANTWLWPVLKRLGAFTVTNGPLIWAWLKDHPDVLETIKQAVVSLTKSTGKQLGAIRETLAALRAQIDYLRDSADDDEERAQAERWSKALFKLESAVALIAVQPTADELRQLRARVDELRGDVLSAYVREQIEDAGGTDALARADRSELPPA